MSTEIVTQDNNHAPADHAAALAIAQPTRKTKSDIRMNGFTAMPETSGEAWAMCERVSMSGIVPDNLRGKVADIFVTVALGDSVGLNWMQALQGIAVIGKKASLYGDHFLAVIQASPHYERHEEWYELDGERLAPGKHANVPRTKYDKMTAFCLMKRKGDPEPSIQAFSWDMAQTAGLIGKAGPWTQYPLRQLQMRARGFAGRDKFSDALKGLVIREEALDIPDEPRDVTPAPDGSGNDRVRQLISRAKPAAEPTPQVIDSTSEAQVVEPKAAIADAVRVARVSTNGGKAPAEPAPQAPAQAQEAAYTEDVAETSAATAPAKPQPIPVVLKNYIESVAAELNFPEADMLKLIAQTFGDATPDKKLADDVCKAMRDSKAAGK
jgi:hypothetical protein